jgi:branched-chain amino acid transport system ATP-binding protein
MTSPQPLLSVSGMTCAYGAINAVRNLCLEVREGEIVALLGPNGAGKSTALRAISGMRPARSATVTFAGQRIERWPSDRIARLGMSLVPEGRGLFTELSIEENLRMGGYAVEPRDLDARIDEVCATFPVLASRRGQAAGTLSGGEQQQLAIARALLSRPRLLIVDEMSLGLAPTVVYDLYRRVREIHAAGTSMLLVEQQVTLALGIADRAYFMERGTVTAEGPAERFRDTDTAARTYLGEVAGNGATPAGDDSRAVEHVKVPLRAGQARTLQRLARARDTSVGDIVATAVDQYLETNKP